MWRGDRLPRIVEIGMDKAGAVGEAQLACQVARHLNCHCGEVETDHLGAALRQY
jgi:hypothetical protein